MDYFLKICVPILIIGFCVDKIESATEDRTCHFCRETNDGPCHKNGKDVETVRCDTLLYSRSTNYEVVNGDNDNDGNSGGYMGGNDNSDAGGELEPRNGGRPPPSGSRYQCVKERRRYHKDNRNVLRRTCVLDHFAASYCQGVTNMGESAIYDKFELTECHLCDNDNCNFGNSLSVSFGLMGVISTILLAKNVI